MPLMLINASDDVAVAAVQHLGGIQVLAMVTNHLPPAASESSLPKPRSWVGLLPKEAGLRMLKEVAGMRDEWEQNT